MSRLTERLPFVKDQRDRVQRIMDRHPEDNRSQNSYPGVVRGFDVTIRAMEDAVLEISELKNKISELEASKSFPITKSDPKIGLSPSDVMGLPPELIANLSLTESDFLDFQIIEVIEAGGGVMSLDHILIGLYKETNEVHDRIKTSQRIYRMTSKGKIHNVRGMKAVYTTRKEMIDLDSYQQSLESKNPEPADG